MNFKLVQFQFASSPPSCSSNGTKQPLCYCPAQSRMNDSQFDKIKKQQKRRQGKYFENITPKHFKHPSKNESSLKESVDRSRLKLFQIMLFAFICQDVFFVVRLFFCQLYVLNGVVMGPDCASRDGRPLHLILEAGIALEPRNHRSFSSTKMLMVVCIARSSFGLG